MRSNQIYDLSDGTEFRQTLQACPPRIVHGTAFLLATLLGSALLWAALTKADLVVRASGRVRPVSTPTKVYNVSRSEVLSASIGGRVVEVNFREGEEVRQGDVLIRLETERLDNDIARRRRLLRDTEEKIAQLFRLEEALDQQFEAARAKAEAELAQGQEAVRQAKERQAADIRSAQIEWDIAQDEEVRLKRLVAGRAAAVADLVKATARLREAQTKLDKARLPVEVGQLEVLRRALTLADKEQLLKRQELEINRGQKSSELEAARMELASLELERKQAVIRAPMNGVVTAGDVAVGDVLASGKPVLEIAEQTGFRFEALVPTEEAAHLRLGLPARIKLDAYDYQKYGALDGTVCFISPDSGVQQGQQAACYLVRIDVAPAQAHGSQSVGFSLVKLGMAGQAEIVTEQESILALLIKRIRQSISLG